MTLRIPVVAENDRTDEQKAALIEWSTDRGVSGPPTVDIWTVILRSAEGMRRVGKLGAFARETPSLTPVQREIGIATASWRRRLQYEISFHESRLRELGVDEGDIETLRDGDPKELPDGLRELSAVARAIADGRVVTRAEFDAALAVVGETGLVEFSIVVGYFLLMANIAHVFIPGA
jgi:alkylhydroperoxidase family enzyme